MMRNILKSALLISLVLSSAARADEVCMVNVFKGEVVCQNETYPIVKDSDLRDKFKSTAEKTAYIMTTLYNSETEYEILGTHKNCGGDLFYTVLRKKQQ